MILWSVKWCILLNRSLRKYKVKESKTIFMKNWTWQYTFVRWEFHFQIFISVLGLQKKILQSSVVSLTNSDFPTNQTFHQFHDLDTELDRHWIMSGFHGAFATGVASQQGTLTLPDTWFRPPFWDLLMLQLLRPNSSNLPCLYSTFHLEYPLVLSRFCF